MAVNVAMQLSELGNPIPSERSAPQVQTSAVDILGTVAQAT
jgi:hypothetical protein